METNSPKWVWKLGTDPAEVHELLCSCDRFQAERYQSPVPQRSFAATEQRVREGSVHVLYAGDRPAGMFTLTWEASDQPDTPRAARLGRLAVDPRQLADGGLIGVQCVRRAVDVAREIGAEVLRSEANPDLAATRQLLGQLGFEQVGPVEEEGGVRRVALQKSLRAGG